MPEIRFTQHAQTKLQELRELGVGVTEDQVIDAVLHPDRTEPGKRGETIAQKGFDERHVLRVPYVQEGDTLRIITLYPARRDRYEKNQVQP